MTVDGVVREREADVVCRLDVCESELLLPELVLALVLEVALVLAALSAVVEAALAVVLASAGS